MSLRILHGLVPGGTALYQGERTDEPPLGMLADCDDGLQVPLHTLIKLTPMAYGCEEERFHVPIAAVDTHRPKPARRNTGDGAAAAPTEEKKSGAARDYFGDAAPTATSHVAVPTPDPADAKSPTSEEEDVERKTTTKISTEKARQNVLLQHAEEHGKKASEVTQEEAGISQADIARALHAQSMIGNRAPTHLIKYYDLPEETAENALYAPVAAASTKKYNRHKMYCPRDGCNSLILSTGTADWVVRESGMVRHPLIPKR